MSDNNLERLLPLRSQIKSSDKWRLEDIYSGDESWQAEYDALAAELDNECAYKGRLAESAKTLLDMLCEYDSLEERLEKIYVYAFLKLYEDMSEPKSQVMAGKAQTLSVRFATRYSFMESEIIAIPEDKLCVWIKNELAPFAHLIEDMLLEKVHTLSEENEQLLAASSLMQSAPKDIFSQFNNSDIEFGNVTDENGTESKLTSARFGSFMESSDRRVRKEAFTKLYAQYKSHINMLAATYEANVKQARFYAGARKYGSTLEMYLSQNNIPTEVYTSLIDTVNENIQLMHRYAGLRKKALGVDELHMYDVYAPMTADVKMKVDYKDATKMVLEGLKPLGDEYAGILKEGFENGWIDVRESRGKRSGAFSWGEYGTHPFVCLNYSDTLNDVFTIAHEMGHAIHTYYSNKNQPHVYAGYRIFVAEVASTCNEVILMKSLLEHCDDDAKKKYLLNHFLEQFKGTLFRQTMFAEFEMITHAMSEKGEPLNADNLCSVYRKLNEKYFGPDMVIDDEIAYEWSRIPHFYTPFYVYQYATGFSAAIAIATKITDGYKNGDNTAREGYFRFLSGGSSMHPIELLKLCGIDMETTGPVENALKVFGELLDEMEKIL